MKTETKSYQQAAWVRLSQIPVSSSDVASRFRLGEFRLALPS